MLTIRISEMVSFGSTKPWMPSAEARINIDLERGGSSCGPYSRVYATAVVTPTEEGDLMTAVWDAEQFLHSPRLPLN